MLEQLSKIIYDFFQVKIMTSFCVRNILGWGLKRPSMPAMLF